MSPDYLRELVPSRKSSGNSISFNQILLHIPVSRLKTQRMSVVAYNLWNRLPVEIRKASFLESFKSVLKTHHLF